MVRVRDFRLVGERIVDLSARGMLVETDLPILTGEEVLVTFKSPTADRWYDCDGVVARVLHGRRRDDRCRGLGIAFDGLDPWSQMLLCDHLSAEPLARGRARAKALDDRRAAH